MRCQRVKLRLTDSRGRLSPHSMLEPTGPFDFAPGWLPALQLEVPDHSTAYEVVVLAALASIG